MTISSPWDSLIGGVLLGISATLMLLMNGKIAGISGILTGLLMPKSRDFAWRLLFVLGLIFGGMIGAKLLGHHVSTNLGVNGVVLATAGLLIGVGARLANGCTSGHGISGIGRLSKRSIVATCVFMATAAITVFVRLHLI